MSKKPEIYVSIDVEADGPAPLVNSMLSFGAAAFDPRKGKGKDGLIGKFSANLHQLPDATPDPDTMAWWATQPEAWEACRRDLQDPAAAMRAFAAWIKELPGKQAPVCYPVGYDWTFIYVYFFKFLGENPLGRAAFDIKSYSAGVLGLDFFEAHKDHLPKHWFDRSLKHTHLAIDDALEQGVILMNAKEHRRQQTDETQKLVLVLENTRAAIRKHRDEKGHDRCWLDDLVLYRMLPEGIGDADLTLPPKEEFLRGCDRYYELRRAKTKDEADAEARRLAAEGKLGK